MKKLSWVPWICGLILIANFFVLRMYGDTLQSTHLFIVRGTVFYPLAWLNLIGGILLIFFLACNQVTNKRKSGG